MFSYKRTIHLRETDATGVLYFSQQLNLALEALEAFFLGEGFTLQQMIDEGEFSLPIVHAEADFTAPMRVGDQVSIDLSVVKVGTSSFTLGTRIHKNGVELGTTTIVQAVVAQKTGRSVPLPERLIGHLQSL